MATCYSVFGLVLVVATFITAIVSNLTPFWIMSNSTSSHEQHAGLWQNCTGESCDWTSQNDISVWLSTTRIVHAVAVGNALVSLMISMSYLCCSCCRYAIKALQFNILVLVIGCMETVAVVTTYAVKFSDITFLDNASQKYHLDWSFYVAAGSGVLFILSVICHLCETSNAKRRERYEPLQATNVS